MEVAQPAALGPYVSRSDVVDQLVQAAEDVSMDSSIPPKHAVGCRWFILKQGKIFWFKSDVVTPVRFCAGCAAG